MTLESDDVEKHERRILDAYHSELRDCLAIIIDRVCVVSQYNIYNDVYTRRNIIRHVGSISGAAQLYNHEQVVSAANNLRELLEPLDKQCDPHKINNALQSLTIQIMNVIQGN